MKNSNFRLNLKQRIKSTSFFKMEQHQPSRHFTARCQFGSSCDDNLKGGVSLLSEDTLVTTKEGVKSIAQLKPQDELITSRKSGGAKWTRFCTYIHRDTKVEADFIVLTFSNGTELKVTGEHLVYICNGENGRKIAIQANKVKEGDEMYHLDSVTGVTTTVKVMEKRISRQTGIYAPLTTSGHFLANGILVTCYAVVDKFEIAHAAFAPLRTWHKVVKQKKDENLRGIHTYAETLMKFADVLPQSITRYIMKENKV